MHQRCSSQIHSGLGVLLKASWCGTNQVQRHQIITQTSWVRADGNFNFSDWVLITINDGFLRPKWDQWFSSNHRHAQYISTSCKGNIKATWSSSQARSFFLSCSINSLYVIFLCILNLQLGYAVRKFTVRESPPPPPPPGVVTGIISVLWRDSLTAMLLILCRSALNASFLVNLELSPHILCKSPRNTALHQSRFSPYFLSTAR